MNSAGDGSLIEIAGHAVVSQENAGGLSSLRIALRGAPLVELARALSKLDGVRVTTAPETPGRDRCYLVHCSGFKVVLSAPAADDHALALVSRAPQAGLAVMSDLGATLEHLMSAPPSITEAEPAPAPRTRPRSTLRQGKPLARKTELKRKTPLARGRFNRF